MKRFISTTNPVRSSNPNTTKKQTESEFKSHKYNNKHPAKAKSSVSRVPAVLKTDTRYPGNKFNYVQGHRIPAKVALEHPLITKAHITLETDDGFETITNPQYLIKAEQTLALFDIVGTYHWWEMEKGYRLPQSVVIFNHQRLALHSQGILVSVALRNLDDESFVNIVNELSNLTLAYIKHPKQAEILNNIKYKYENPKALQRLTANPDVKADILNEMEKVKSILIEKGRDDRDAYKIAKHLVVNDLHRKELEDTIQTMSQTVFDKWYEKNQSEIIVKTPQFKHDERAFVCFCGGPATGKSKAQAAFTEWFDNHFNKPLSEAAVINTDRMRLLMLYVSTYGQKDPSLGSNIKRHGDFTHFEARSLMEKAMHFANKLAIKSDQAPLIITECFEPSTEIKKFANGVSTYIIWTLYGPYLAVHGDRRRYEDQKERLMTSGEVLAVQKKQKDALVRFMHNNVDQDVSITLFDTFQAILFKETTNLRIADIDCKNRNVKIHHLPRMLDLFKFTRINVDARFFSEVYSSPKICREEELMKELIGEILVSCDYSIELEHNGKSYAKITRDNTFEIKDKEIYKHLQTDYTFATLFKVIEAHFTPNHTVSESLQSLGWKP